MRTSFDVADILYRVLANNTDITGAIDGGVFKYNRPINSNKTDVVIGSLPIVNLQIQRAVANINIHAPNLVMNGDTTQPDTKKLKSLTAIVCEALDDKNFEDYWFGVQQQNLINDNGEWYSNIRVNFYSENI